jgi:hypothetical protein
MLKKKAVLMLAHSIGNSLIIFHNGGNVIW